MTGKLEPDFSEFTHENESDFSEVTHKNKSIFSELTHENESDFSEVTHKNKSDFSELTNENEFSIVLSRSLTKQLHNLAQKEGIHILALLPELIAEGMGRRSAQEQMSAPSHLLTRNGVIEDPLHIQPSLSHHEWNGSGNSRKGNFGSRHQNTHRYNNRKQLNNNRYTNVNTNTHQNANGNVSLNKTPKK